MAPQPACSPPTCRPPVVRLGRFCRRTYRLPSRPCRPRQGDHSLRCRLATLRRMGCRRWRPRRPHRSPRALRPCRQPCQAPEEQAAAGIAVPASGECGFVPHSVHPPAACDGARCSWHRPWRSWRWWGAIPSSRKRIPAAPLEPAGPAPSVGPGRGRVDRHLPFGAVPGEGHGKGGRGGLGRMPGVMGRGLIAWAQAIAIGIVVAVVGHMVPAIPRFSVPRHAQRSDRARFADDRACALARRRCARPRRSGRQRRGRKVAGHGGHDRSVGHERTPLVMVHGNGVRSAARCTRHE